ncbi:MAG TPA: zf-HC2 domain-containing protein, partial [Kofleriaceae bacterium]|nr:zf-HC2 domain-containing protein [Kofleriaceae bacterium]
MSSAPAGAVTCAHLHAYVDGELSDAEHAAYEAHLATCEACNAELPRLLALIDAVEQRPVVPIRSRRRRSWPIAMGVALVALAAGVVLWLRPAPSPTPAVSFAADLRPTRSLAARLAYPGADRYRPIDVMRGDPPAAVAHEPISLDRLAALERAGDWHGLAVASLLAGERARAQRSFEQ